ASKGTIDEDKVCWICAESVKYYSVSECNHRTCHVCALRLRALYKKLECTFCKEPQPTTIFTISEDRPFSEYTPAEIPFKDGKLSIFFETQEMMEESLVLLRYNCPDSSCDYVATGWNDLKLHARGVHGKLMCDLCLRHKKVFSHEHALYAPDILAVHLPSIPQAQRYRSSLPKDQIPGGVHPICGFDRECFFGDDELYSHMREKHEECFICKRNEVRDQYFRNYDALEKHFENAHFPCPNSSCQQRKFVVFGSMLDLKAHMVEEHGAEMTSRQQKDARRVQAGFEFQEVNGGRRRGGREREREPPPGSGAGSSSEPPGGGGRAGNSRRNRFGGHLTIEGEGGTTSAGPSRPRTPTPPPADMDPVTAARYNDLYNRLRALAPNPTNAIAAVRLSLRSFTASEMGARDLISTVWNILNQELDNTASIVNALVDFIEDEEKKSSLLGAWNGFKLEQRRQFPDLVPTSIGTNYAGITGGRMLRSAAASRQSSSAIQDRVAQAASGARPAPSNARTVPGATAPPSFPPLPAHAPGPAPTLPSRRSATRNTAWSASAAAARPAPVIASVTPRPRPDAPPAPKLSSAAFPELPSAAPRSKGAVRGNNGSLQKILGSSTPTASAWGGGSAGVGVGGGGGGGGGSGSSSGAPAPAPAAEAEQDGAANVSVGGGKKRGKGKQKQTLFTLGSFPT
ncbi:hypothetical protein K488DRAFT_30207, partial [Vararia minispora EC-137]